MNPNEKMIITRKKNIRNKAKYCINIGFGIGQKKCRIEQRIDFSCFHLIFSIDDNERKEKDFLSIDQIDKRVRKIPFILTSTKRIKVDESENHPFKTTDLSFRKQSSIDSFGFFLLNLFIFDSFVHLVIDIETIKSWSWRSFFPDLFLVMDILSIIIISTIKFIAEIRYLIEIWIRFDRNARWNPDWCFSINGKCSSVENTADWW